MAAVWPRRGVSLETKKLITHFFSLVDLPETDAGKRMAAEIFTEDGIFAATTGQFQGKGTTITSSRNSYWALTLRP